MHITCISGSVTLGVVGRSALSELLAPVSERTTVSVAPKVSWRSVRVVVVVMVVVVVVVLDSLIPLFGWGLVVGEGLVHEATYPIYGHLPRGVCNVVMGLVKHKSCSIIRLCHPFPNKD